MKSSIFFIAALIFCGVLSAQDSTRVKHRIYKASISTLNGENTKGYLAAISDSALYISNSATRFNGYGDYASDNQIGYNNLNEVKIKRRGAGLRGAIKGALLGLTVGVITGYAQGDDPACIKPQNDPLDFLGLRFLGYALCEATRMTASEKATANGLLGVGGGAIVGALVGTLLHKKFIIGGKKENLRSMKLKLVP